MTMTDTEARSTVRGWIDDPSLWVLVTDEGMIPILQCIGHDHYDSQYRAGWFEVASIGLVDRTAVVASLNKSRLASDDLSGILNELGEGYVSPELLEESDLIAFATDKNDSGPLMCAVDRWLKQSAGAKKIPVGDGKPATRNWRPLAERAQAASLIAMVYGLGVIPSHIPTWNLTLILAAAFAFVALGEARK